MNSRRHSRVCVPRGAESRCGLRPGFTLLEILIVGVLTSVLMLGVWSLFRTWGRLYERGEQRVQAAQLVRSLCDQFTDDVRSVAFVSPPPRQSSSKSNSRSRRSGRKASSRGNQALVGGPDWLVLEVLQPPNPFLTQDSESAADAESEFPEDRTTLYAPELQRVIYTFQPPASEGLDSLSPGVAELAALDDAELVGDEEEPVEPFSGLLRMVVPVEQYDQLTASGDADVSDSDAGGTFAATRTRRRSGLQDAVWQLRELAVGPTDAGGAMASATPAVSGPAGEDSTNGLAAIPQDQVPEVIWFEFRYFDGSRWNSTWDSRVEGRLPVAIEMRFELKEERFREDETFSDGETELVDDGLSDMQSLDEYLPSETESLATSDGMSNFGGESVEETPYVRCVVHLDPAAE